MLFNLVFASNTVPPCFFFCFLIINLYFLIPAFIAQIFNPIPELVIPLGIRTKEAKQKLKHRVNVKAEIRKCSM